MKCIQLLHDVKREFIATNTFIISKFEQIIAMILANSIQDMIVSTRLSTRIKLSK